MTTKFLALISVIGLASICLVQGQSPTPGGSPAASPSTAKHRTHKKAEATASPAEKAASSSTAESPTASPSSGKRRSHKKAEATAATSPAAESTAAVSASPAEKRSHKKARTETAASGAASPAASASPAKFTLGDLFKPKTSASASPAAANPAPAASTRAEAATNATPAPGGGHGLVWVNTDSHVYHKEGSRFYGKTKKGKYLSEADAIKEGDRAAAKGH
jgi:hypothetical protein